MIKAADQAGKKSDSNRARIYWEIGDKLVTAGLIGRDHYGESILEQMGEDLEINPQNLRRAIVFRRLYDRENLYRGVPNLTWSAYRLLIQIHDDEARRFYEDKAIKEGWSRDRLRAAIAGREFEREVKKEEGAGILQRPTDAGYVFRATVRDVSDADTVVLDVDCGFKIKKEERLRLAGINAPEIETKKGKEAFQFVRDTLAKAQGIVIKTEKVDAFGRYVAHVFYSFETDDVGEVFAEGHYLNDVLLKKKMADRM
jgi:endonuclease YncB( thermonuclease family)